METVVANPAVLPVSGFWRRLGAFVIDGLVLGVVGAICGALMFDTLAQLGVYGRAIGFAVALVYFGLLNSRLGGGQTLGKRVLSIRATMLDGRLLSVPRSLLRYSVLGVPFFLNNAPLPMDVVMSPLGYLLSLVVFGGLLSIIYLFVFNRATRRSLHDFAAGSWVVRAETVQLVGPVPPLWRGHLIVVALVLLASLLAPLGAQRLSQKVPEFADLLPALDAINAEPGVMFANLNVGFATGNGVKRTYTAAMVQLADPNVDDEAFAKRLATKVIQVSPRLGDRDVIAVNLRYGFDLGIASGWRGHRFQFSPDMLKP
jgi:uncharacterized RDD family membrane protein YckC